MIQVGHLFGNLQGRKRFNALFAGRNWVPQNELQVTAPRLQVLPAQQAQQLRGGTVLGRQQIGTAGDVVEEGDRLRAQRGVLLKVLEVLRHPVSQHVQDAHRGR